jgi:hypothetical protein
MNSPRPVRDRGGRATGWKRYGKRYGSATSVTGCVTPPLRPGGEESIHTDQCTLGAVHKGLKGSLLPTPFPVSEAKPLWRSPIFTR